MEPLVPLVPPTVGQGLTTPAEYLNPEILIQNLRSSQPELYAKFESALKDFCITLPDGTLALDYTTTNTYEVCPLKSKRRYLDHLTTVPETRRPALEFGHALHKAWETWYGLQGKVDVTPPQRLQSAIDAFVDDYTDIPGEELRTRDRGMRFLKYYADRFPSEDFQIIQLELPITFDIGHPRIKRLSKVDAVVKWPEGQYSPFEHKHTAAFGDSYFNQFSPNEQIDTEIMAVRSRFGPGCYGAYVNCAVIRKGGPRSKLPEFDVFRELVNRTEQDLEWTRRNLVSLYYDIELRILRHVSGGHISDVWPGYRKSCHEFRTGCPYRRLCKVGDNDEPQNVDAAERERWFREEKWDPFKLDEDNVETGGSE